MLSQKMVYIIIAEYFFKRKSKASYLGFHIFSDVDIELGIDMLVFNGFSRTFKGFFETLSGSLEPANSFRLPPRNSYSYADTKILYRQLSH